MFIKESHLPQHSLLAARCQAGGGARAGHCGLFSVFQSSPAPANCLKSSVVFEAAVVISGYRQIEQRIDNSSDLALDSYKIGLISSD